MSERGRGHSKKERERERGRAREGFTYRTAALGEAAPDTPRRAHNRCRRGSFDLDRRSRRMTSLRIFAGEEGYLHPATKRLEETMEQEEEGMQDLWEAMLANKTRLQ